MPTLHVPAPPQPFLGDGHEATPVLPIPSSTRAGHESEAASHAKTLAAMHEFFGRVVQADGRIASCQQAVEALRRYFQVQRVALGLCDSDRQRCECVAVSNAGAEAHDTERAQLLQAALQEGLLRGDVSYWGARESRAADGAPGANLAASAGEHALCCHRQLALIERVGGVLSVVLFRSDGLPWGVCLLLGSPAELSRPPIVGMLRALEQNWGRVVAMFERQEERWWRRLPKSLRSYVRGRCLAVMLSVVMLLVLLLAVPMPSRVTGRCTLQAVARRTVAAPFAAELKKSHVKPGDVVTANQLLAELDGREIRWELEATEADLRRATHELSGHRVKHAFAQAQIAEHEVARLTSHCELLRRRIDHLEIRSPIAGLVITGDWERSEGVPLAVGDELFEIAPLEEMVVEVAIPETSYQRVAAGMPLQIRLDAFPQQVWQAELSRIHPRAEVVDEENVFLAEVRLNNEAGSLRPGMRGRVHIRGARETLAWQLWRPIAIHSLSWLGW